MKKINTFAYIALRYFNVHYRHLITESLLFMCYLMILRHSFQVKEMVKVGGRNKVTAVRQILDRFVEIFPLFTYTSRHSPGQKVAPYCYIFILKTT